MQGLDKPLYIVGSGSNNHLQIITVIYAFVDGQLLFVLNVPGDLGRCDQSPLRYKKYINYDFGS